MHFSALIQIITLALAAFTTTLASPVDLPELVSRDVGEPNITAREGGAVGQCLYNGLPFSYNYQLKVDSSQDGGLCGGFWDNLKGRANCAGKSNNGCKVSASRKIIEFTVGVGCAPKEVSYPTTTL